MEQRWVFQKLVTEPTESHILVRYISYALYKAKKAELANTLYLKGTPEAEIERRLKEYHDNTLHSDSECEALFERAGQLLDEELNDVEKEFYLELSAEIEQVKIEYTKKSEELEKDKKEFEKKKESERNSIRQEVSWELYNAAKKVVEPSRGRRVFNWWLSGAGGVVASLSITIIVLGGMALFQPETRRGISFMIANIVAETLTGTPLDEDALKASNPSSHTLEVTQAPSTSNTSEPVK